MINMLKNKWLLMDLQLFSDPTPPPADPTPPVPPEPEKKYTDKDVDDIINKKFAKWEKEREEKERIAKLSEKEREAERIKQLEQLQKDVAKRDAMDASRKLLSADKLPTELAEFIYATQEDVSKENYEKMKGILSAYREVIVNEIMRDKTPPAPKPPENGGSKLGMQLEALNSHRLVK